MFITQEKKLSNYVMIMLKLYQRLFIEQSKEKELKY